MGVSANRVDLTPPVGAGAGLPLSFVWADDLTNAGGAGTEKYALFDTSLWQPSGTSVTAPSVPLVIGGSTASTAHTTQLVVDNLTARGLTTSIEGPRLNFGTGWLESGQAVEDVGFGRHNVADKRTFHPFVTATISEAGRHVDHPRVLDNPNMAGAAKARPANHSWNQPRDYPAELKKGIPSMDLQIGSIIDANPATSIGTVESFTHRSVVDLPSNGLGLTYGDAHNSAYLSSLWSAPVAFVPPEAGLAEGQGFNDDALSFSAHWGVNMQVQQEVLNIGQAVSAPAGTPEANQAGSGAWTPSPPKSGASMPLPATTAQTILVSDIHTETGVTGTIENIYPLGRVDLGNHAVADSCGLIGYEGIITATAFTSVSRNSNPPFAQAPPASPLVPDTAWNEDGAGLFSAINIQVSSGLAMRRNGMGYNNQSTWTDVFRYASDDSFVEPMTEGMSTTGKRKAYKGSTYTENANRTLFHTGRAIHTNDGGPITNLSQSSYQRGPLYPANPLKQRVATTTKGPTRYILGDTHSSGAWTATLNMSQDFMKDKIVTKVKVVPALIGTVDVQIPAHASASAEVFKKPIVDYHVLVSLAPATRINATVNLTRDRIGDPTQRNFPQGKRLSATMDLEDEACEIYHAVFRINPAQIERVYFDLSDIGGVEYTAQQRDGQNSFMPRHDAENGGWGLHQMTPFRPLANTSWAQVPLLCGAIEAGGFYQRGGISHLWDADVYGKQLFVGADMIDASHFNAETWGNGQVWADGDNDLLYPRGCELMVYKYDPATDPYYTVSDTTPTDNPLYDTAFVAGKSAWITSYQAASFAVTGNKRKQYDGWQIHDWVFPQIEQMRYLGREDKAAALHPRHSLNPSGDPMYHPTLHCSALRFMDDGRAMMAAVHRDYIGSSEEYPSSDINYPFNPDSGSGSGCPAGYYRSGDQCIPITSGDNPNTETEHVDPITGEVIDGPPPPPSNGSGQGYQGGGDNFSLTPSWSRLEANTSGRSLVLLWSDAKAQGGKAKGGRAMFEARKIRVDGEEYYTQNWTDSDTWWSGSRIAYWYQESGQRAIPITYGSYPEVRMSYAHLPRCLPHLMLTGVVDGYPMLQPIDRVSSQVNLKTRTGVSTWAQDRYDFLVRTRFVATTIGFSDYGAAANPHQEMGYAGWSFPRFLYDPIGFGNNTVFFSDDPAVNSGTGAITPEAQSPWSNFGTSNVTLGHMQGPMSVMGHQGPLHYGIASSHHPFKVDRTWKSVHGGVGYDIPLHLLAPAEVAVRARAGGRNSLDLEMETPFHRTDTLHLTGATEFNTGFDLGGKATPDASRSVLGQYHLRTNLWDDASRAEGANAKIGGLLATDRVRGPIVSGSGLEAFWNDHPTEHFHAGAIPIMPNSDYSISDIESNRYAPAVLGRIDEISDLDYVAVAEQLQSSVDVHVSGSVRPMWDSGSIISARGTGARDSVSAQASQVRSEMDGQVIATSASSKDNGMGKGQRMLRTDDGTLHSFQIERSGKPVVRTNPVFCHYTKPLFNDLFWNRKSMSVAPSIAGYDCMDECGPTASSSQMLQSAAYAADSEGTIHAIINIDEVLFYTYAKRVLVSYNPHPVYEWDWSQHTAVAVSASGYDLRQPSLVCDGNDRLHLACRMVADQSHIIYTTKLAGEDWTPMPAFVNDPADWLDTRWSKVNKSVSSTPTASENAADGTSHAVRHCDAPKVCLTGGNVPIVYYRGSMLADSAVFGDRANAAIYVNTGRSVAGGLDPSGRFTFNHANAMHCVGVQNASQYPASGVIYYDAVIDERDRSFVTVIKSDNGRTTLVNSFNPSRPLIDQRTDANGLGVTKALFIPKNIMVRPDYKHITMTTNGKGEIHMVLGFRLSGVGNIQSVYAGRVYRDGVTESTIAPLQWGATPANDDTQSPPAGLTVDGGYDPIPVPLNYEWPTGGTNLTPLSGPITHFMEVWMPTFEFSQDPSEADEVIRSVNIRWLSVPSMTYHATTGWTPVGSAQSLSGQEDFTHTNPQLRYQRFWGFSAGELDLQWMTNESSWQTSPHGASRLYFPYAGGSFTTVGEGETSGAGIAGWPL
jgi:hypothetical protein